jgi:serine/threonine protein kinase
MNRLPERPDRPPSAIVRAAQARLLDRLDALPVDTSSEGRPDPLDGAGECTDEDRYEFGELLATGGLGLVRRAFDRRLGRTVAVKELQRSDPAAERRFLFEAAITAHLQHPGIVPIYDTGRFPGGGPYYCMKLVDGESLEQIIGACETAARRLTLLEHVLAAADAVAYAHSRGIIHRDLKPANILVGEHGETLVIDWGLAKDLAGAILEPVGATTTADPACSSTLTDVGAIVGTLRYMPPEQARGEAVDRRSDVFALGAVLFHVIAGRPPHEGLTRAALLARLADGEVEELAPLADGVPRALVAIAQKAMASGPEDRYPRRRGLRGRSAPLPRRSPGRCPPLSARRAAARMAAPPPGGPLGRRRRPARPARRFGPVSVECRRRA